MAITAPCFQKLKVCAVRVVRLDADGAFLPAPDNMVVSHGMTVFTYTPLVRTGETIQEVNGCGDIAVDYEDDDRQRGRGTIEWSMTTLDAELLQACVGGTLLLDGGATVGWEPPGAADSPPNGVAIEVWGWAYDTDEVAKNNAGTRIYRRLAVPLARFNVPTDQNENAAGVITLNGKGQTNSGFGTGPAGDWPASVSIPGAWFWDETGVLPAETCGSSSIAIAS